MPEETKKGWFSELTPKLKRLTIIFSFIAALGASWTFLKIAGIDILDFTIGCSSMSNQTEQNTKDIDTLKTKNHWKWQHQTEFNDSIRKVLDRKKK